jgi:hypothetical protein
VDICRQHLTLYLVRLRLLNTLWSLAVVEVVAQSQITTAKVAVVRVVY